MGTLIEILASLEKLKTKLVIERDYERAAKVRELIVRIKYNLIPIARTNATEIMEISREMTFGEKLVGLTFNPSGDPKVQRAKELCAQLADLLNENADPNIDRPLCRLLFDKAIGDILDAQMNVVKVLTFKY